MGIKYEYEPEGFQTPAGYYLPDFRVQCYGKRGDFGGPPFDLWIEVKGKMTEEDAKKIRAFANVQTEYHCEGGWTWESEHPENPILILPDIPLSTITADDEIPKEFDHYDTPAFNYELIDGDYFGAYPAATKEGDFYIFGADSNYINKEDEVVVNAAYKIARQARFERGEHIKIINGINQFRREMMQYWV